MDSAWNICSNETPIQKLLTDRLIDPLGADTQQGCRFFLNQRIELVQVDRFYKVMLETDLATSADILFHPETGESNSERRF